METQFEKDPVKHLHTRVRIMKGIVLALVLSALLLSGWLEGARSEIPIQKEKMEK